MGRRGKRKAATQHVPEPVSNSNVPAPTISLMGYEDSNETVDEGTIPKLFPRMIFVLLSFVFIRFIVSFNLNTHLIQRLCFLTSVLALCAV